MRVVEARNERSTAGIDDARRRPAQGERRRIVADDREPIAANGHGCGLRLRRIDGVDESVVDDEVGTWRLLRLDNRECDEGEERQGARDTEHARHYDAARLATDQSHGPEPRTRAHETTPQTEDRPAGP